MLISFGIEYNDTWRLSSYRATLCTIFQAIFAIQWIKISDRINRKRKIMISFFKISLPIILFGFTQSCSTGLAARCLISCFTKVPAIRAMFCMYNAASSSTWLSRAIAPFILDTIMSLSVEHSMECILCFFLAVLCVYRWAFLNDYYQIKDK